MRDTSPSIGVSTSDRRRSRRAAAGLVTIALLAAACSGDDADRAATTAPTPSAETTPGGGTPPPATSAADAPAATSAPADDGPTFVTLAPEPPPEDSGSERVPGGTLRFGMGSEVDGLNPTSSALTTASGLEMAAAVFEKLAELTPDGEAVPWLAESFEPNETFTEWTVRLRPGVEFHDGTPFDAEAVRINFEAQLADPLVGIATRPFYPDEGAIEVVDELTVRYHLLEPNAHWPAYMASQLGMVASPAWIAAALEDPTLNQQPVGTGPFRFDSRSEDSLTRFVRFDGYWGEPAYLDAVEYHPVPSATDLRDLLAGGELDMIHLVDPLTIAELRDRDDVTMMETNTGTETVYMLNTAAPPFDDLRARQALALATPKQQYLQLIGHGTLRASDQMFTPESPFYNPEVRQRTDEPDAAAALVAEYCAERGSETNPITGGPTCTDGRINMEYQYPAGDVLYVRIADVLEQGWGAFFNVTRQELITDTHILETTTGGYNAVIFAQFGALDPMSDNVWLMCRNIGTIALNFPRYCDEQRDAELLAAQAAVELDERAGHYREVVRLINESYAYIFMTHTLSAIAMAPGVHGTCDRTAPGGAGVVCFLSGAIWPHTIWLDR